jgi:hypothetical protein
MWSQFFLENAHFALNVFAALTFFAVAWLYFDAGLNRENIREILRVIGFSLLSTSFLAHAAQVESTLLPAIPISSVIIAAVFAITRIGGYLSLIASLLLDPIQPKPQTGSTDPYKKISQIVPVGGGFGTIMTSFLYPFLALMIALMYLRRATIGLERHLKPVAIGFLVLTVSEFMSLFTLFRTTTNVRLFEIVAPFGPIWIVEHLILLIASIIIVKWVFGYLLKRFETQLFIILTTIIVIIFLIITVSFTGLLVSNVITISSNELSTDAKVLVYTISAKQAEILSDTQAIAADPQVLAALDSKLNRLTLADTAEKRLIAKKQSFLIIVGSSGQVVARGEDKYQFGDSLSSDPLVKLALTGKSQAAIKVAEGVMAPEIVVYAASPIMKNSVIVGAVVEGITLDNAFLDGIQKATGLEASLYGGNIISATTLKTADSVTRPIGIKLENTAVKNKVLTNGKEYLGSISLLNRPYFASYLPLTGIDNSNLGMIFVGVPQRNVLTMAGRSIELTFLIVIVLMVIMVIPAYVISKYIASQVK